MPSYDWFLVHANADKPRIRPIYEALTAAGVTVFLDEVSLLPGDVWPKEIPKAQKNSKGSLLCLSKNADAAWFLQEEVQDAIRLHRQSEHRLFPILLEADAQIPYGLNILQAVRLYDVGLPTLVQQVVTMTGKLTALPTPAPVSRPSTAQVVNAWTKLMPSMRKGILFLDFPEAAAHLAENRSPYEQAIDLVNWASLQGVFDRLVAAIRREGPALL